MPKILLSIVYRVVRSIASAFGDWRIALKECQGRMSKHNKKLFDYKKNQDWAENLQIIMQIGLTMAGCIVLCFFVGWRLDKWLGTKGIFVAIFTILGVIGGGVVVYRQILEITEIEGKDKRKSGDGSA